MDEQNDKTLRKLIELFFMDPDFQFDEKSNYLCRRNPGEGRRTGVDISPALFDECLISEIFADAGITDINEGNEIFVHGFKYNGNRYSFGVVNHRIKGHAIKYFLQRDDIRPNLIQLLEEADERIDALGSFEEVRSHIRKLNEKIVKFLAHRNEFPVCRMIFEDPEVFSQWELRERGIDSVGWNLNYSPIVGKICEEGELFDGERDAVIESESYLEALLYERVYVARKVIEYKAPRGKDITVQSVEDKIIKKVREEAENYCLNPDAVQEIFEFLMKKNKHVQRLLRAKYELGDGLEELKSTTWTMQPGNYGEDKLSVKLPADYVGPVDQAVKQFKEEAEKLKQETKAEHNVIVEKKPGLNDHFLYRVVLYRD